MSVHARGESGQVAGLVVTQCAGGEDLPRVFACTEGVGYFSRGFDFFFLAV